MGQPPRKAAAGTNTLPGALDAIALLDVARTGNTGALDQLYRDHLPAALRYAYSLSRSRDDAEDLVAECFTRVFAQLIAGAGPATSFRAYLFTAMRHEAFNRRMPEVPSADLALLAAFTDELVDGIETEDTARHLVRIAFARLDRSAQDILTMRAIATMPASEVSAQLGTSATATAMRYARAKARLAVEYLRAALEEPPPACPEFRDVLMEHARGSLDAPRGRRLREHLMTCHACAEHLARLGVLQRRLAARQPASLSLVPIAARRITPPRGVGLA